MKAYRPEEKSNSKIANWSKALWANRTNGIILALIFNLFFFYVLQSKQTLFSVLILGYFVFLLYNIIKANAGQINEEEPLTKEELDKYISGLSDKMEIVKKEFNESISNGEQMLKVMVMLYILYKLTKFLPDIFFLWIVGNLCILHYPLNKLFPGCIFKGYLIVSQTIEGVIGLVECLIPRYIDEDKAKNA